ncbi:hypothetical protein VTK56DRAFT_5513 [Thermocarpiscus australiensis]
MPGLPSACLLHSSDQFNIRSRENCEVIVKPISSTFNDILHRGITSTKMSYAEVAAKGPKQSPEEAAAPQPPRVETASATSTSSLVDVDHPSVRTVPSDFADQEVTTDTQAARAEREQEQQREREEAERAEADLARKKQAGARGGGRARRAENWLVRCLEEICGGGGGGGAAGALAAANIIAVVGLSGWLGYKAWGLYDRGRLGWREVGIGLGVFGAVGVVEGVFANYFYKARSDEQ